MLQQPASFSRRGQDRFDLSPLSGRPRRAWFEQPGHADLAAVADFNNDRYALTVVPLAEIGGASAEELCAKRSASFAELFDFTCSSGAARSYVDASGTMLNDLDADQPRFDWTNGRRQLALNGASANLILDSAAPATQVVSVTAQGYVLSFSGTGTIALSGAASVGPLTGSAANQRVALAFTPAAGALTLTISGDVRLAQLEANSFASPYIPTGAGLVSRAAETTEFSPVLAALIQRSAATVAVRGQRLERNAARIVGVNGTSSLIRAQSNRLAVLIDGSSPLATSAGLDLRTNSYGAASAFDVTGRAVVRNGAMVAVDGGTAPSARSNVYLGRDGAGTSATYGDGWYDGLTVAPMRLSDDRLQRLAALS